MLRLWRVKPPKHESKGIRQTVWRHTTRQALDWNNQDKCDNQPVLSKMEFQCYN